MKQMNKKNLWGGAVLCCAIAAAVLLWSTLYYAALYRAGTLLALRECSAENYGRMLAQHLCVSAPELLLAGLIAVLHRRLPVAELALTLPDRRSKCWTAGALAIFAGVFLVGLIRRRWSLPALLYAPVYYLLFIAFFEEFVFRAVMPMLLHGGSVYLRYLLPNFLFSLLHITMPIVTGTFTLATLLSYTVGGFILSGCLFQLVKEKTGTLWVPVLLHAAMDMGVIFS